MILSLNTDVKEYPPQDSFFYIYAPAETFREFDFRAENDTFSESKGKYLVSMWFFKIWSAGFSVFFLPYFSSNLCTLVYAFNGK